MNSQASRAICPGQDMRFWRQDDIFEVHCAKCGHAVEFFKDDARRSCPHCGAVIANPKLSIGCAQWCAQAEQCLGFDPNTVDDADRQEAASLCDRIVAAVKEEFGDDHKRIEHALRVLDYAQQLLQHEPADPRVVVAAALLHDIGIHEAERKHGSAGPRFQELEGPAVARRILEREKLDEPTIEHVCRIVGAHHSARNIDTPEFRIVWDADWLVNIPDEHPDADTDVLTRIVEKVFRTQAGERKARELFLTG